MAVTKFPEVSFRSSLLLKGAEMLLTAFVLLTDDLFWQENLKPSTSGTFRRPAGWGLLLFVEISEVFRFMCMAAATWKTVLIKGFSLINSFFLRTKMRIHIPHCTVLGLNKCSSLITENGVSVSIVVKGSKKIFKNCSEKSKPLLITLFTISKRWKQPKCLSAIEMIKWVCVCLYTHTHTQVFSALKRKKNSHYAST